MKHQIINDANVNVNVTHTLDSESVKDVITTATDCALCLMCASVAVHFLKKLA